MTRPSRGALGRAAVLFLLTLPFLVPVLRPGWIQSHEGLSYPVRQAELLRCWEDGLVSARWFPNLNYGQGYPFLSFYAPLVFFSAGPAQLAGAGPDTALKIPLVLSLLLGAAGAYRLARLGTSRAGGLVAAALFTYAPYRVRDVFIRGDVAEFLAMGMLPWALWSVLRLRDAPHPQRVPAVALFGAAAILSHNILGMLTGIAMAGAGLIAVAFAPAGQRLRTGVLAALGGAGALVLTAFFWLPALHERQFVRIDILTTGHNDFTRWFVSPLGFLARGEFPGRSQALPMSFELGWAMLLALAAGAAALFLRRGGRRPLPAPATRALAFTGALLLGAALFMCTAAAGFVYRLFPLLEFVQFPWRFLALAALGGSLLGGLGVGSLVSSASVRARGGAALAFAALAVVLVLPLLGPRHNAVTPAWAFDPATMWKSHETTTNGGEFLPLPVEEVRRPRGFVEGLYRIEGDATLTDVRRWAGRWTFRAEAAGPAVVALRDVAYPGWTATSNGELLEVGHVPRDGNLTVALPPGSHDVRITLEPTSRRRTARVVSLAGLLLLGVHLGFFARRRP